MEARRLCTVLAVMALLCPAASPAGEGAPALTVHLVIDESQSMRGSKADYTRAAVQTVVALLH